MPDSKALPNLYRHYRAELVAFVRTKFGAGPPEPEDVVQQAFANFLAHGSEDTVANPRAFLFRTVHNIALNDRKHQRVGRRCLEDAPSSQEVCEARADWDPEVVLIGREQLQLIESVIRAMPEKRRQVLLLNRLENLSYAEIARRMGLSESVIRKHAAYAIRECAACLGEASQPARKDNTGHD